MKMGTKKTTGRQWAAVVFLSFCGALAFSMVMSRPDLPAEQQTDALTETIWNLRYSLAGTFIQSSLYFGGFVGLSVLVCNMKEAAVRPALCCR